VRREREDAMWRCFVLISGLRAVPLQRRCRVSLLASSDQYCGDGGGIKGVGVFVQEVNAWKDDLVPEARRQSRVGTQKEYGIGPTRGRAGLVSCRGANQNIGL
jgi:hypothetical protein